MTPLKEEYPVIALSGNSDIGSTTPVNGAQPPARFTGLKLADPKSYAAGVPGILIALQHAAKYMSPDQAVKTMFKLNQKGGIDCPGCAWPDPDDERSSLGEYCENGVKAIAEEASSKKIDAAFFAAHSIEELLTYSDFELGKLGRLAQPMVLREGATHYEPITWEEAFATIGQALNELDSPDEAVFYTSGRASNEAAFLYQLFVREFGTNNLPDCSNMCHESSGVGLSQTIGIGKGTVTLTDFYEADLVIVMGQNPGTNHPRMLSALERCKENGGKIISINPLPEAGLQRFINPQRLGKILSGGTPLSDLFLQVRINGDMALLRAIELLLLEADNQNPGSVFDRDFINQYTSGYEDFVNHLQQYRFQDMAAACGVPEAQLQAAAAMIQSARKIIVCWAMGITQHENGVDNVREIVNLLLLKGSIGKPGAGLCPVRGHSNVQGDRTMGIWETPKPEFLDQLEKTFGFAPPRRHGFSTVEAIQAMYEGKARVFFALGGNFLSATPDTEYTAHALQRCRLTAHVSTKLNRSHLIHGRQALILPCLGRTDRDEQSGGVQFVTTENSMGVVQQSKGILPPCSPHLLSEPAIVAGMARATLGMKSKIDWKTLIADYDRIRDLIAAVIPGFDDFNRRVREPGGFYLPNGPRERRFPTPEGKALFTVNAAPQTALSSGQYVLMTIRSHDQFNTTIYGLHDRYRGIYNERRVALMNAADMAAAGLQPGQVVDLFSEYDGITRLARQFIVVEYAIPSGCIATYFPEANALVPVNHYARESKTPISKSVIVRIQPAAV